MKIYSDTQITKRHVTKVICDRCWIEHTDTFEIEEFLYLDFIGGYGSIFGDGSKVECDLCQNCVKELLGKHLKIK